MAEDTRPLCACHSEPMLKNGVERRYRGIAKQEWRCAIERRAKARKYFEQLEHVAYNRRLLQMRRATAMQARRRRAV